MLFLHILCKLCVILSFLLPLIILHETFFCLKTVFVSKINFRSWHHLYLLVYQKRSSIEDILCRFSLKSFTLPLSCGIFPNSSTIYSAISVRCHCIINNSSRWCHERMPSHIDFSVFISISLEFILFFLVFLVLLWESRSYV